MAYENQVKGESFFSHTFHQNDVTSVFFPNIIYLKQNLNISQFCSNFRSRHKNALTGRKKRRNSQRKEEYEEDEEASTIAHN